MNRFLLLTTAGLLALPGAGWAQNELSNFTATGRGGVATTFATDYQCIGINPANLGRKGGSLVAFTIGEVGAGVSSQALTRQQLRKFVFDTNEALTPAQKQEFARAFTSDNVANFSIDATTVGLSVQLPVVGGVAVSHRLRTSGHIGLNQNAAEIAFLGRDAPIYQATAAGNVPLVSEALAGTNLQLSALSEFNLAWGTRIIDLPLFQLSAGAGYRYIQGVGIIDIRVEPGDLRAYSSLSPLFNVDYGNVTTNPSFNLKTGAGLKPVGEGHGFDVGVAAEVGKAVRLGLALTDLGHMTWTGNLLTANDQKLKKLKSEGIGSYNFIKEAAEIFGTGTDSLFEYKADQERRANLPTKLRAGAGVRLSEYFEAGLDVTLPLNDVAGNFITPFVGAGLDFKPTRWLRLSSGLSGGAGYGLSVPLGLTISTSFYEAGVSTRDVVGLVASENPYLSAAAGFLRFRLGGKSD
ncbi:DUF5723 family protein [Hymenobacter terrestris]|uniref:DUF5723 domain-containing protein n=1 Tax=Hymenobacter terrestris TaxID=2748310 RepID=A0ABX2Q6R4_9BACT|nr:DUF5723 family protein [Hymenobacter terrestris]NVO86665.1 hypothetical protein [Hymenobacter terrestris]